MCWNKGRLCWKIANLFYFCHLKNSVRPETFGPYYVCVEVEWDLKTAGLFEVEEETTFADLFLRHCGQQQQTCPWIVPFMFSLRTTGLCKAITSGSSALLPVGQAWGEDVSTIPPSSAPTNHSRTTWRRVRNNKATFKLRVKGQHSINATICFKIPDIEIKRTRCLRPGQVWTAQNRAYHLSPVSARHP